MGLDERSKGNYQPWNQEGFNADIYVRKMTSTQRWIYKTLLQEAFVCSTRPKLPDNDEELWMLGDCETLEQWLENKSVIITRFSRVQIDGVPLLSHNRLENDWSNLLSKRGKASDAGKRSAEARSTKRNQPSTDVEHPLTDVEPESTSKVKESKEELKESRVEESTLDPDEPDFPENGQGETEVKAKKEIPNLCLQILGVKAEMFPDQIAQIERYAQSTSNGQVVRQFEEWATENIYEEFRGRPVAAFLRSLENPRATEAKQAASDPLVVDLARELAYLSDGVVSFNDKEKSGLGRLLADGNTKEELVSIFRTFFADIQNDEFALKFAAKNFVEKADQLVYTARRKKADKQVEAEAVARTAENMVAKAEQERLTRKEAREKESELMEDELPD